MKGARLCAKDFHLHWTEPLVVRHSWLRNSALRHTLLLTTFYLSLRRGLVNRADQGHQGGKVDVKYLSNVMDLTNL